MDAADMEALKSLISGFGFLVLLFVPIIALGVWGQRGKKKMPKAGYKPLTVSYAGAFWIKDGMLYYNPGFNPDKAKPIEVIGVSEITRNTRLVQLEIRFRMDGIIQSKRISGSTNQLLSIEDKLGYSI